MSRWVVLKFGGTSVATVERWETIAAAVEARIAEGMRPVAVCSALSGVSNLLEDALRKAPLGNHAEALAEIERRHAALAEAMGLDPEPLIGEFRADLGRILLGASLLQEVTPRQWARVMSAGELMSTRLGAAWLAERGLPVAWVDARTCLRSLDGPDPYRSATCADDRDDALIDRFEGLTTALVTQGFIARNARGETTLLGRGGSDTSAALFAAALGAERCEIWTDVPGMFSADPRHVPDAALLTHLSYDEAQEIASTGAKVLHPRCIAPVRKHRIPLQVRCTQAPDLPGTSISDHAPRTGPSVKAISVRTGVPLVAMDTVGMWQQVGFLADVFACFKRRGLSVDLVSTSETHVTVSLDPTANALDPDVTGALLDDLAAHCTPRIIGPCAAVSLVGRRIRGLLHRLGPVLELFEEQRIHLVSQAASDLNLTFVVDEDQASRLVRELHAALITDREGDPVLGPTWQALQHGETTAPPRIRWWERRRDDLLALGERSPLFVLDGATLDARASDLVGLDAVDRVFYAMKANPHPDALRRFAGLGVGFECVSPGELAHVRASVPGIALDRLLFTPNFAPRDEYADAFELGVRVTVDNLYPLEAWPDVFAGRDVMIRVDTGHGRGHHSHVRTAGARSKFGISQEQLDRCAELAAAAGARIVGLHAHIGSGIRVADAWGDTAAVLGDLLSRFPDARILDLGGGFGVPEKPGQKPLDLDGLNASLARVREAFPGVELWLEPGRYLVSEAGVLLVRVTQLKHKGDLRYVGVDAGMNSLIRPALYGAWHEIVNLTRLDEPASGVATVVGPICESGDTLGYDRRLPDCEEGDVLLIGTTGAYGRAMASRYNLREPADEVVI